MVSRQNDKRERRKDVRELVVSLDQLLFDVLKNWQEYSSLDGDKPEALILSARIKSQVSSVPQLLHRISLAGLKLNLDNELILLRQQVTGGDFDSKTRKATDFSEDRSSMISLASLSILRCVEERYFETYPVPMTRYFDFDPAFSAILRRSTQ